MNRIRGGLIGIIGSCLAACSVAEDAGNNEGEPEASVDLSPTGLARLEANIGICWSSNYHFGSARKCFSDVYDGRFVRELEYQQTDTMNLIRQMSIYYETATGGVEVARFHSRGFHRGLVRFDRDDVSTPDPCPGSPLEGWEECNGQYDHGEWSRAWPWTALSIADLDDPTAEGEDWQTSPVSRSQAGLAPLSFLVGACWYGEFPGQDRYDVHCFEPLLGGRYIRDVHAVPGPEETYRGETIYWWDEASAQIRYLYFNSGGGVSEGRAVSEDDLIRFPDERHQSADGRVRVIASTLRRDGADAYLARSTDVTLPDNPTELVTMRFERISWSEATRLAEGGL
jgi:hypothetical protein